MVGAAKLGLQRRQIVSRKEPNFWMTMGEFIIDGHCLHLQRENERDNPVGREGGAQGDRGVPHEPGGRRKPHLRHHPRGLQSGALNRPTRKNGASRSLASFPFPTLIVSRSDDPTAESSIHFSTAKPASDRQTRRQTITKPSNLHLQRSCQCPEPARHREGKKLLFVGAAKLPDI